MRGLGVIQQKLINSRVFTFAVCSSILAGQQNLLWRKSVSLSQSLLPEFDHEMANTRVTLERVPESKFAWKPHQKSGSMGWLAAHLADLPSWTTMTIKQDSVDIAPQGAPPQPPAAPKSTQELLEKFDRNVKEARAALARVDDPPLPKPCPLLNTDHSRM